MLQTVGNRDHRTGRTEPGKVGKSGILFLRSIWVGVEHFFKKSYLTESDLRSFLFELYLLADLLTDCVMDEIVYTGKSLNKILSCGR